MTGKDKLIKELLDNLSKCIDYMLRLEAITGSKAIDRPNVLEICREIDYIKKNKQK